jgi:hypothetical protein
VQRDAGERHVEQHEEQERRGARVGDGAHDAVDIGEQRQVHHRARRLERPAPARGVELGEQRVARDRERVAEHADHREDGGGEPAGDAPLLNGLAQRIERGEQAEDPQHADHAGDGGEPAHHRQERQGDDGEVEAAPWVLEEVARPVRHHPQQDLGDEEGLRGEVERLQLVAPPVAEAVDRLQPHQQRVGHDEQHDRGVEGVVLGDGAGERTHGGEVWRGYVGVKSACGPHEHITQSRAVLC